MDNLEQHFEYFSKNIVGNSLSIPVTNERQKMIYADWAASGRLYKPIENYISNELGQYVANTHTETTYTGRVMTTLYHQSFEIIKSHVNAGKNDVLLFSGFGMTSAVNKLQRILGLRVPEVYKNIISKHVNEKPLVILTHMEHHSNQTSWVECLCDVEILPKNEEGLPDLNHLREILLKNKNKKTIIGAFTACSNVTGIITPYHEMAEIMHEYDRFCFVDFAASAPYVEINMHPEKESQSLDAIYFSPHKFLGGPGSSGVLIFNKSLYKNTIPDHPGGGTVVWTNPWREHRYFENIEVREDGGTPGFLQAIKAALSVSLKQKMGIENILKREHRLTEKLMDSLGELKEIRILEEHQRNRLGFISFYHGKIHHNLFVRLLNDKFAIQTRGGCSCAGTYGHILLNIDYETSHHITDKIDAGEIGAKPGWVRVSIHPTMTDFEIDYIVHAVEEVIKNNKQWSEEYRFNNYTGDFEQPQLGIEVFELGEVLLNE